MKKQHLCLTLSSAIAATALFTPTPLSQSFENLTPLTVEAAETAVAPLKLAVISDLHIFPESYIGNKGPNYQNYINSDRKMLEESERILDAYINEILASDVEVVLVPGDLTKDSEPEAHQIVARQLQRLEDAGKAVFVTNGNHDINAPGAEMFVPVSETEDEVVKLDGVTRDEFETIHHNFGFNSAETIAQDANSTSYAVQLKPGYRLIVMDTGIYGDNKEDQSTSGTLNRDGRLEWVLNQITDAKAAGEQIIGMAHHGFVEHFDGQGTIFAPYLVENYETIATQLADAGMDYVFTGHFHAQDIAVKTTESGNTLMDIMTGATASYPSPIRYVDIDAELGKIHVESHGLEQIAGIDDFQTHAQLTMEHGVPTMVSSLLADILTNLINGILTTSQDIISLDQLQIATLEQFVGDYVAAKLNANSEQLAALRANNTETLTDDWIIEGILSKQQLINFIDAVCTGLETVEIETTIADNYQLMDAVTHVLIACYAGDEVFTEEMQILANELTTTASASDALTELIIQHKNKLGLTGLLINEKLISELFHAEISPGQSLSSIIGGALAGLIQSILVDETPDNNAAYMATRLVDFDLSAALDDAKALVASGETGELLLAAITTASAVISDETATEEMITQAIADLRAAIANPSPNPEPTPDVDQPAAPGSGPVGDVTPSVEPEATPTDPDQPEVAPTPDSKPQSNSGSLPNTGEVQQAMLIGTGLVTGMAGVLTYFKRKKQN